MCLKLASDAIFIADSHYSAKSQELLAFLHSLQNQPPSQIILMGDITQVLVGNLKSSIQSNFKLLEALDQLEKRGGSLVWLEGNHDLFLSSIPKTGLLQNTLFVPRKKQPLLAIYGNQTYLLSHGDLFLNLSYELYIQTLTHIPHLLCLIDYLSAGEIYEELEKKLECKAIKKHAFHFFDFASQRIQAYTKHISTPFCGIIEGHFHIGKKLKIQGIDYVALPAFYFHPKAITLQEILHSTPPSSL